MDSSDDQHLQTTATSSHSDQSTDCFAARVLHHIPIRGVRIVVELMLFALVVGFFWKTGRTDCISCQEAPMKPLMLMEARLSPSSVSDDLNSNALRKAFAPALSKCHVSHVFLSLRRKIEHLGVSPIDRSNLRICPEGIRN
uniref:Transmembrane protein n=1 Tax=Panagrellus redivivus TaxID=6233 RepID=A0A7E4ZVN9_PANRE